MPWVKLTDDWYDDPDLIAAGPLAMLLWPVLVSWSARNLTDGEIPSGQVRRLVDWQAIPADPEQAIAPLIDRGRLQAIADGYQIVNYLRYQPSRQSVLETREKDARRKRQARPGNVQTESAGNPSPPVPGPVPDTSSSSSSTSDQVPDTVWTELARKRLAIAKDVKNVPAWTKKVIANDRAELGERATWLWNTYQISPSHLADVLLSGGTAGTLTALPKRQVA